MDYTNGGCAGIVVTGGSGVTIRNVAVDARRLPFTVGELVAVEGHGKVRVLWCVRMSTTCVTEHAGWLVPVDEVDSVTRSAPTRSLLSQHVCGDNVFEATHATTTIHKNFRLNTKTESKKMVWMVVGRLFLPFAFLADDIFWMALFEHARLHIFDQRQRLSFIHGGPWLAASKPIRSLQKQSKQTNQKTGTV